MLTNILVYGFFLSLSLDLQYNVAALLGQVVVDVGLVWDSDAQPSDVGPDQVEHHVQDDGDVLGQTEQAVDVGLAVSVVSIVEEGNHRDADDAEWRNDATQDDELRRHRRRRDANPLGVDGHPHVQDEGHQEDRNTDLQEVKIGIESLVHLFDQCLATEM